MEKLRVLGKSCQRRVGRGGEAGPAHQREGRWFRLRLAEAEPVPKEGRERRRSIPLAPSLGIVRRMGTVRGVAVNMRRRGGCKASTPPSAFVDECQEGIIPSILARDTRRSPACMSIRRGDQLRPARLRARFRLPRCASGALQKFPPFNPVSDPSAIIAYLRITEIMQQGDRLLTQLSGEFPAVNGDPVKAGGLTTSGSSGVPGRRAVAATAPTTQTPEPSARGAAGPGGGKSSVGSLTRLRGEIRASGVLCRLTEPGTSHLCAIITPPTPANL
jgi:hypothetical protein